MQDGTNLKKGSYKGTSNDQNSTLNGIKWDSSKNITSNVYGAIDLGTNNCRLLIARPEGSGFRVITSFSRIVRLGEGLTEKDNLDSQAMDRALSALDVCAHKIASLEVKKLRNIATEACRKAKNCEAFLDRVYDKTGLKFEIISSDEEAQIALLGCQTLLSPKKNYALVFDIGGGSTEIIWAKKYGKNFKIIDVLSLPLGVVTLSEQNQSKDIDNNKYRELVSSIFSQLKNFNKLNNIEKYIKNRQVQMLGISGTVTTLGALHLNLQYYNRGLVDGLDMTFQHLQHIIKKLIGLDLRERAAIPCIGRERAELIIPGCAILDAICLKWEIGKLKIADRGLREGMLLGLMASDGIAVTGNPAANLSNNINSLSG